MTAPKWSQIAAIHRRGGPVVSKESDNEAINRQIDVGRRRLRSGGVGAAAARDSPRSVGHATHHETETARAAPFSTGIPEEAPWQTLERDASVGGEGARGLASNLHTRVDETTSFAAS